MDTQEQRDASKEQVAAATGRAPVGVDPNGGYDRAADEVTLGGEAHFNGPYPYPGFPVADPGSTRQSRADQDRN